MTPISQADVAGTGGEERLQRGVGVRLLLPPVADQHERAEADQLPADEHLQGVVGDDQQQHRRAEQAQRGEEVRVAPVAVHVLGGVHVHQQRDQGDDEHHHHREAVDLRARAELDAAVAPPRDVVHHRVHRGRDVLFRAEPARRSARTRATRHRTRRAALPSASLTRCTHCTTAPHDEHERRADRRDPDLGAVARHALAEEQDRDERHRRDERHQPRVIEEEHEACLSPSARRRRRGRCCAGCGRSAARSRGRRRLRRRRW